LSLKCLEADKAIKSASEKIGAEYANKYDDRGSMLACIEALRKKFIVANKDNDLSKMKIENIPSDMASDVPAVKWLEGEIVLAFKSLDEIDGLSPQGQSMVVVTKLENLKRLHFALLNGKENPREVLATIENFEKKILDRK